MKKTNLPFLIFTILSIIFILQNTIYANTPEPGYIRQQSDVKVGKASWYSQQSPGINKTTANNEIFDDTILTAAMWDVPFHQKVKVTNIENRKSVIVRINDRGPHRRFVRRGRLIDLSKGAFKSIAPLKKGLINIQLELL